MSQTDVNKKNNIKSKTLITFKPFLNFDKDKSDENNMNSTIIKYSYPICIFKNIKKESEEIRNIQYRIICSKKEKELKEKTLIYRNINNNLKRSLSTKLLISDKKSKIQTHTNNININPIKKKLIRSKYNPLYHLYNKENSMCKKGHLSQIEKRGNYYNKIWIASLQRQALNNYSLFNFKERNINRDNINFVLNNKNNQTIIEESEKKNIYEDRQFLNNRVIAINEKKNNIDEYFNMKKKKNLPKIKKKEFKFHIFHDKNGLEKDLSKTSVRILKMTKTRIRDLKVMGSINKIRDPEIIQKYRTLIYS